MVWLRLVQGAKNGASFSSPKPMAFTSHADLMKRCWGAVVGCGEAQLGETGQIWRGFFFGKFWKVVELWSRFFVLCGKPSNWISGCYTNLFC